MIRRIRRRFIRIALLVLAITMVLLALVINAANWINVRSELSETLTYLAGNSDRFGKGPGPGGRGMRSRGFQNRLNESRFFSVYVDEDGEPELRDVSRVADYAREELMAVARQALDSGRKSGFSQAYLYLITDQDDGKQLAMFLNCETKLAAVRELALISAAACAGGILLAWLLVSLFSRRAIQPMIDNAIQQKQFITDAGHELKTPLTVISANMDVLALETGENEWVRSTQKQVSNLRSLVNELIYLSRLDEEDAGPQMARVDLSALLREAAEPFADMAEFAGKTLTVRAEDDICVRGDAAMLNRLVSVLCDNAVKYAPKGDEIVISLRDDGRRAVLRTENGLEAPMSRENLDHLFDRFYRSDPSRSRESGGYGIGLSVARAIVEKHGGGIRARQTDSLRLRFTVTLPRAGRAS